MPVTVNVRPSVFFVPGATTWSVPSTPLPLAYAAETTESDAASALLSALTPGVFAVVLYVSEKRSPSAVTTTPNFATRAVSEPLSSVTYFAYVPLTMLVDNNVAICFSIEMFSVLPLGIAYGG